MKESLGKAEAEIARLRCNAPPPAQAKQELTPQPASVKPDRRKEPKSAAKQLQISPQSPAAVGSPLKRPPPLHVMAQRAGALSPGRTRSFGSPTRGANV